jgi:altronate dehydratase small subunit
MVDKNTGLNIALKVDEKDNVATIFANDIRAGMSVDVLDKRGELFVLKVQNDIPYGHKIALRDIHIKEHIMKYGESIGFANREIPAGDYVHVHNMEALRGRGDI